MCLSGKFIFNHAANNKNIFDRLCVQSYEWKTGFEYSQAKFIIAKAAALNGQRTILHTSDQCIEKYEIDKEFSVVFPIDDLRTLYGLQAWHFPDNFKNSNLNEFQVFMPEKGEFDTVPWP